MSREKLQWEKIRSKGKSKRKKERTLALKMETLCQHQPPHLIHLLHFGCVTTHTHTFTRKQIATTNLFVFHLQSAETNGKQNKIGHLSKHGKCDSWKSVVSHWNLCHSVIPEVSVCHAGAGRYQESHLSAIRSEDINNAVWMLDDVNQNVLSFLLLCRYHLITESGCQYVDYPENSIWLNLHNGDCTYF